MKNNIWVRLVLPLIFLFFISLLVNTRWKAEGFFINLATEIIGIVITISYVDWVLQLHEKRKWSDTDARITNRLMVLLNGVATAIRTGLNISYEILDEQLVTNKDLVIAHKEMMRVARDVIAPIVHRKIKSLNQKDWRFLATNLQNENGKILKFLDMFQNRLSPDQISYLLDIQGKIQFSLIFYTTFPDLAGVPENELPETRTPPELLQFHGYKSTAESIQQILELCSTLSDIVIKSN